MVLSRNREQLVADEVPLVLQTKYYTLYTEEPHINCAKKFTFPQAKQHPIEVRDKEADQSLTYPASKGKVSGLTERMKPP